MSIDNNHYQNKNNFYDDLVQAITLAKRDASLIFFIGAGVSMAQGYPSWNEYVTQLINYWTYRLHEISPTHVANREDMLTLGYLATSNMDNKRKVDLVHHLLKKYSVDSDGNFEQAAYQTNLTRFEKEYFSTIPPLINENSILNELVKLGHSFITTNYDSQIEKIIESNELAQTTQIIPDISKMQTPLSTNSVVHLHGTPDSNPKFFLNSSESYRNLYLIDNNEHKIAIRNFLNSDLKKTIIFVGSSMEEEEILALLGNQANYFALMKRDTNVDSQIENHYHQELEDYYLNDRSIKFVWYGRDFNDLPNFLENLNTDVTRNTTKLLRDNVGSYKAMYSLLTDANTTDENFISTVNQILSKKEYVDLNKVFDELESLEQNKLILLLNKFEQTHLFKHENLARLYDLSNVFILYNKNFELLKDTVKSQFLNNLLPLININLEIQTEYFELLKHHYAYDTLPVNQKLNYTLLLRKGWSIFDVKHAIPELLPFYFIDQMQNNEPIYLEELTTINGTKFIFENEVLTKLIEVLLEQEMSWNYNEFAYLLEYTPVNLLKYAIENAIITDVAGDFPASLLDIHIVQRILINLNLEGKLNDELYNLLIDSIDINWPFYGSEMNRFLKQHPHIGRFASLYGKNFQDGISVYSGFESPSKALLTTDELLVIQSDKAIDILTSTNTSKETENFDNLFLVDSQRSVLNNLFKDDSIWKSYAPQVTLIVSGIIENDYLRDTYGAQIETFITSSPTRLVGIADIITSYLKHLELESKFKYEYQKVLEFLIANDTKIESIMRILITWNTSTLNLNSSLLNPTVHYIDLNGFNNSELGYFFNTLISLPSNLKYTYKNEILTLVTNAPRYNEYLAGRLYFLLKDTAAFKVSIDSFQGFSHSYTAGSDDLELFKNVVMAIIKDVGFADEFSKVNIMHIIQGKIDPSDLDNISPFVLKIMNEYFSELICAKRMFSPRQAIWIKELIQNNKFSTASIPTLVRQISKISIEKIKYLQNLIMPASAKLTDKELNSFTFRRALRSKDKSQAFFSTYAEFIGTLLQNRWITVDTEFINFSDSLLSKLESQNSKQKFITNLSSEAKNADIVKLQNKYSKLE